MNEENNNQPQEQPILEVTEKKANPILLVAASVGLGLALIAASYMIYQHYMDENQLNTTPQVAEPIQKDSLPVEIASTLIYTKNSQNQIQAREISNDTAQTLVEYADVFALSADRSKLLYGIHIYVDNLYTEVFILDIQTRDIQSLNIDGIVRHISLVSDENAVLIETGTGPEGAIQLISLETQEIVCPGNYSGLPIWINDTEFLYTVRDRNVVPRPWETGSGEGIGSLNVETCESVSILNPTDTQDFRAISLLDNKLVYSRTTWGVNQETSEIFTNMDYWLRDLVDGSEIQLTEQEIKKLTQTELDKALSKEIAYFSQHQTQSNWYLIRFVDEIDFYVVNIEAPADMLYKISESGAAYW